MRAWFAPLIVILAACGPPSVGGSGGGSADGSEESTSTLESSGTSNADGFESFDGSETEDTEHSCGGFEVTPVFVPPNIMFVVDVSSSMLETWDHDQDPMTPMVSRWLTARTLLEQVIAELASPLHGPRFGLQRAPSIDACPGATLDAPNCTSADVCLVEPTPEIALGDLQGELILASLPDGSASPLEIVGGSPISAAWLSARDHLLAQSDEGFQGIVLITDGGANCSEASLPMAVELFDDGLEALVSEGYAMHGIPTVVVGVDVDEQQPSLPAQPDSPAVDTYAALNGLALAGGIPWNSGSEPRKFFDAAQPDDLLDMFGQGPSTVTDCTVDLTQLPEGPPQPSQIPLVVIEMNGDEVPYVVDCAQENGWSWIEEGEILTFCGSFCEAFKAGTGTFEGTYGCPPF
jgi:hypothetical protein